MRQSKDKPEQGPPALTQGQQHRNRQARSPQTRRHSNKLRTSLAKSNQRHRASLPQALATSCTQATTRSQWKHRHQEEDHSTGQVKDESPNRQVPHHHGHHRKTVNNSRATHPARNNIPVTVLAATCHHQAAITHSRHRPSTLRKITIKVNMLAISNTSTQEATQNRPTGKAAGPTAKTATMGTTTTTTKATTITTTKADKTTGKTRIKAMATISQATGIAHIATAK